MPAPLTSPEMGVGAGPSANRRRVDHEPRARTERRWFFASLALHALVGGVCVLALRLREPEIAPVRRDFAAMNFQPLDAPSDAEAFQAAAPAEPPPELPGPEPMVPETPDVRAPELEIVAQALPEESPPEPGASVPPLPTAPALPRVQPAPPTTVPSVAPTPPPAPPAPRPVAAPPSGAVEGAKPFDTNRVVYPPEARARGITGVVLLGIGVGVTGRVTSVQVLRSSGHAVLDEAAKTDALGWQFSPARRGGVPVPARVEQPVGYYVR